MSDSGAVADARQAVRGWFGAEQVELQPLGEGHIHSTWRVARPKPNSSEQQLFVLQKINQAVFSRPAELMANLDQLFVDHSWGPAAEAAAGSAAKRAAPLNYQLPQPLAALSGGWLVSSGTQTLVDGTVVESQWRLSTFIGPSQTLQAVTGERQAEAVGRAFGEFQRWLERLARAPLAEVIPGFHQVEGYVQALQDAAVSASADDSPVSRRQQSLLRQLQARDYLPRTQRGVAPHRDVLTGVIHGDCKVNNLLFAEDAQRIVAILDLDTLMRGPWWLDFGDLVRSATCSADGQFRRALYPPLAAGFFAGRVGDGGSERRAEFDLTDALRAPAHMAFMLCVRFLTDHLRGDTYFKVVQRGDNLQRAEQQFRLLETLEDKDTVEFMRDALSRALSGAA